MKRVRLYRLLLLFLTVGSAHAQFPFQQYPAIRYKEFTNWKIYDRYDAQKKIHFTIAIPSFFLNNDTITIQFTSYPTELDSVQMRIFRNKEQVQTKWESMYLSDLNINYHPVQVADINGDGLKDLKMRFNYMGNGIASLNEREVFLFQTAEGTFIKISYNDKIDEEMPERDFDNDGNFEIISMTLESHGDHNYWTFNLYNFDGRRLVNVNERHGYPIMVQFLFRKNYKVTDKISKQGMKQYSLKVPEQYQVN